MPPHMLFEDQIQILGAGGTAEHQSITVDGKEILVAGISNLSQMYRAVLAEELKKLGSLKTKCHCSVLVLHEAIDQFFIEEACELALTDVPKNFDYYAMGICTPELRLLMVKASWRILAVRRLSVVRKLLSGRRKGKVSTL